MLSSNELWTIIGAIAAILAIFVAIIIFLLERKKKKLSYIVLSDNSLLSVSEEAEGDIQILYNGKPVSDVYLYIIEIINNGNVPILGTDFIEPIMIGFGDDAELLMQKTISSNPKNLNPKLKIMDNSVALFFSLLNKKDSVRLKFLVSNPSKLNIESRILGITKIKEITERSKNFIVQITIGIISSFVAILAIFLIDNKNDSLATIPFAFIIPVALGISIAVIENIINTLKKKISK